MRLTSCPQRRRENLAGEGHPRLGELAEGRGEAQPSGSWRAWRGRSLDRHIRSMGGDAAMWSGGVVDMRIIEVEIGVDHDRERGEEGRGLDNTDLL